MRRTIADLFREEGRRTADVEVRQEILLRLLRRRFGELPGEVEQIVRATSDVHQLDEYLSSVVTVETLEDVGITR